MNPSDLKVCATTLKEVRTKHHQNLDPSITAELDAVIRQLESLAAEKNEGDVKVGRELKMRTLLLIATIVKASTNVYEILKAVFFEDN